MPRVVIPDKAPALMMSELIVLLLVGAVIALSKLYPTPCVLVTAHLASAGSAFAVNVHVIASDVIAEPSLSASQR